MAEEQYDTSKFDDPDFEANPGDPDTDADEEVKDLIANPEDPGVVSEGFAYAHPEAVGVKMDAKGSIVGPPAYGSPDPSTSAARLVTLRNHPLSAENLGEGHPAAISEDYGKDLMDGEAAVELGREGSHHGAPSLTELGDGAEGGASYDDKTVSELKDEARNRGIEGFSSMNKKELIKALEDDDESADQPDNA